MFDNIKVKPLNEDPNKILELLNKNKRNLESLVMQYDGIIEWYIELLGSKFWGKPNSNEVVLPEIIKMLETYDYDCEFTEAGIYHEGQPILTLEEVDYHPIKAHEIHIKNGRDRIKLSGGEKSMINGQRGVVLTKNIRDFSKLDESERSTLSGKAKSQIDYSKGARDLELKGITMISNIAEGVELNRTVLEQYQSTQNTNESHKIYTVFSYSTDEPTICAITYNTPRYKSDISFEEYEKKLGFAFGGNNPNPIEYILKQKFCNYGDLKISLDKINSIDVEKEDIEENLPKGIIRGKIGGMTGEELKKMEINKQEHIRRFYESYDYERLLANIQAYRRKYPEALHPLLTRTYIDNWKTEFGEKVSYYLKKELSPDKCIAGQ